MKNKKPAPTGRPGANLSVDSYSLMGDAPVSRIGAARIAHETGPSASFSPRGGHESSPFGSSLAAGPV